jgi:Protein of unknown function (DUF3558)
MTARLLLVAGAVLLVVACGGGPETQEATGAGAASEGAAKAEDDRSLDDVETCGLLTREQVSAALGVTVGEGAESALSGCRWQSESGASVVLEVFAGSMFAPGTCDAQRQLMSGREEDVPGLGESARWGSSGNLVVCSNRAVVRVDLDNSRNAPSDDRPRLVQVARLALERLGI